MNKLILATFCLALVLPLVMPSNIYETYVATKANEMATLGADPSAHGVREKRQVPFMTRGPACMSGETAGHCVPFAECHLVYDPKFNVFAAAIRDPCWMTDICCPEKDGGFGIIVDS